MPCLNCQNWEPKKSGAMAAHGFAICAHGPRWRFVSLEHCCARFKPAAPEVAHARVTWAKRFG